MKTNSEILVELAEYLGMPQSLIAKQCGFSASHFTYISQGKFRLTERTANEIVANFPDVNIDFLLTGNGKISNNPIKRESVSKGKKQYNTVDSLSRKLESQEKRIDSMVQQIKELKKIVNSIIND